MTEEIRTNTILNGRYLVQKELGQGGMGAVYLAQDMQNRRPVAIKVARLLGPEARAQFQREAVYLQKLHHHSLPRVWDYFSDTQRDFLVMEYIPGEDLETLVQRKGPQPEWLVLRWADELLDGLEYLHSQNPPIIHRDVKPSNLKPRQDETLVLVDFGIAKEFVPGMDTLPGANAVTPGYSPLEQYSNTVTDARSDVYSVGATMYFLLTGHHPPPAPDRASGDRKLLPPSQFMPELSTGTEMVVRKALSLPRDERWANAAGMRRPIAQNAQQLTVKKAPTGQSGPPAEPPPASEAAGSGKRRQPILFAILVGLLTVIVLAALLMLWPRAGQGSPSTPATAPTSASGAIAASSPTAAQGVQPTVAGGGDDVPTFTPIPTRTSSPILNGPAPIASGLVTPTVAGGGGDIPTSTPIPTRTPTSAPATRTPTPTARVTPATATVAPTEQSSPTAPSNVNVGLVSPNSGDIGSGTVTFQWAITGGSLPANQAFEVIFWKAGQDPMSNGFGLARATQDNRVTVDLAGLDVIPNFPLEPGEYLWAVRLVQLPTGQALRLVSDPRQFRFERVGPPPPDEGPPPDPG